MFNMFRKPILVWRKVLGEYTSSGDGTYTEPLETPIEFYVFGSVQPTTGKETDLLPEGRRGSESYTIYTDAELNTPDIEQPCDQVELNDKRFDVLARADWKNDIINHYKYVVAAVQE